MRNNFLIIWLFSLTAACSYNPNPNGPGWTTDRDERDTDERLVTLGWELVEYGKWYKTGYNTFSPERGFSPRNWGKWELTKFGRPDSIYVSFAEGKNRIPDLFYDLHFVKEDYTLIWQVGYNQDKDHYYIDGFRSNQDGSKYTASHKPYLWMGFTEEESFITQKGVLGFEVGKTVFKEVYNDTLNDSLYNYLGVEFLFEKDTLHEIKIEHQNHLKTKEGVCFYSHYLEIPRLMGEPEETTVDLSHWYPSIPEIDSYTYGNLTFVSTWSRTMLILIKNR